MTPDAYRLNALGVRWDPDMEAKPVPDRWAGTEHGTGGVPSERQAQLAALQPQPLDCDSVSMGQYRADYNWWTQVATGWQKDAAHWFARCDSLRRGSLLLMLLLVLETLALAAIAWRLYAG